MKLFTYIATWLIAFGVASLVTDPLKSCLVYLFIMLFWHFSIYIAERN